MCHHTCFIGITLYGFTSIILHIMLQKSQQIGCSHEENVYFCLGNHYTVGYTHNHQKQRFVRYKAKLVHFSQTIGSNELLLQVNKLVPHMGFPTEYAIVLFIVGNFHYTVFGMIIGQLGL